MIVVVVVVVVVAVVVVIVAVVVNGCGVVSIEQTEINHNHVIQIDHMIMVDFHLL